jgi:hypothetical protein
MLQSLTQVRRALPFPVTKSLKKRLPRSHNAEDGPAQALGVQPLQ